MLTVFEDGREREKVTLSDYDDQLRLHALFAEKGFATYSEAERTKRRKMMKEVEETKASLRGRGPQRFVGGGRRVRS